MRIFAALLLFCSTAAAGLPAPGEPDAPEDLRYCGEPVRDARGNIKRSRAVLRQFAKVFPCPATLLPVPSCPGWAIDHILPLASGGCDAVENLQWLPGGLKSGPGALPKDRWERRYHATPRQIITLP